ncbi:MAG: NHLP family bacteriocin export ABC transporter peptidase/permease/ATPase subunit [Candidatus Dormibacteraceae bacterium]
MLQMEATECGAAALSMILAHHGRFVPLEELRAACGISRDGSNAANLMRAARGQGLIPHAWKREPARLRSMDLPMIVFWRFYHFLVIEGFGRDRVFINDPATGPREISADEFAKGFTGIALTFDKGPAFVPGGKRPTILPSLLGRLLDSRADVAYIVICGLLLVAPGIALPALTRTFVNTYLVGQQPDWLGAIVFGIGLAAAVQLVLSALQQTVILRLQTKLSLRMSSTTTEHLLRLPATFFSQRSPGDLAFRSSLNDQVAQTLSGPVTQSLLGGFTASFYAVLMVIYDPILFGVAIVAGALNVLLLRAGARTRRDGSNRVTRSLTEVAWTVASGIGLIESVKAGGGEEDIFAEWVRKLGDLIEARQGAALAGLSLTVGPIALTALSSTAVLGVGAFQVLNGQISLGTLIAFQVLLAGFLAPISRMVGLGSVVQTMGASLSRLDDILNTPAAPGLVAAAQTPAELGDEGRPIRGELELRGVSFGYSPLSPPLIQDLDLHLVPGQRVAIVGASGSGKSTVSRLVSGLYEPWSGDVLIDGRPRAQFERMVLGEGIALVDQDITLFQGTVRDNVCLWDPGTPDRDVLSALTDAQLGGDVLARPGGIWSTVEEEGKNYSGGQRQRMEIARALCRRPALLILDEATSALDPLTERAIDVALRRRGCSCLIVAHRLSTIRDSDEIVVLDEGRVVERGTHESLLQLEGTYARLIEG